MGSALSLSEIVSVNISLLSASVPQPAFGVPLIIGTSNRYMGGVLIKYYSSSLAMLSDGFMNTDPEYLAAVELMEQALQVTQFAVGSVSASVAQINTITISGVTSTDTYTVTINGKDYTYTAGGGDTAHTVLSGLQALITVDDATNNTQSVYNAGGAGNVVITAYNATIQTASTSQGANWNGNGFVCTIGGTGVSTMTNTPTAANHSQVTDLQAIQNVDTGWYCVIPTSINWYDILNMAAYIESQTLVHLASSNDAAVLLSTCTHDVLSQLQAKAYNRTAYIWSAQATNGVVAAAWAGTTLPIVPGGTVWSDTPLVGITPDNLTQTQFNLLASQPGVAGGKGGNAYVTIAGNNIVLWGQAVSGRFFDITIGLDWLKSEIQTNIYAAILAARAAGGKIPYTDKGASIFVGDVTEAIEDGATNGLVDLTQGYSVSVASVASQSLTNKTNRKGPPISFNCVLAGAFSTAIVNGVVSV